MSKQQTLQTSQTLTQQLCEMHKKQATGICTEEICKYQSRILCSDCQFTHQKCNLRMEIKQFQTELQYILNPEMHKSNCHYFPDHSKLLKLIDESFERAKTKFKHHVLDLEQKELAFLLSEQGLILNSNQSNRWAQQLLNLKNMNLSKSEYDSAVTMLREKQQFDKTVAGELKQMFEKFNQLNKNVLEQILINFRLQNQHYDVQQLYDDANKAILKSKQESIIDIEDKVKQQRFKALSGGHESESAIVSITESPTHLITGSNTGNIVGWFKPSYHLDFRIKASEGLHSLAVAKVLDQYLLFAGGLGIIQAFSLQSKLKIYNLTGHTQLVTKMQAYSLKNLISSSNDGTLRIWDLKERKQIKSFNAHSGPLSDFVLSNELVTVGQDGQINFIDVGSQTLRKTSQVQVPIFSIGALKAGKYVLGMGDGTIKIIKGSSTRDYRISDEVIYKVLPLNSKQIVCYSADGNLCILNLKKPSKIFKSQIQKDGEWQDLAYIDQQLMIPSYGSIRIYQK